MAVEAARDGLPAGGIAAIDRLSFASTTMPFGDLQNAAIIAGALGLRHDIQTPDIGQSQRAGTSALMAAFRDASGPALVVASDRPRGKPASTQEISFGAGAAAFTLGSEGVLATLAGSASTALFVDHFRSAEGKYDYYWEERWILDDAQVVQTDMLTWVDCSGAVQTGTAGVRTGGVLGHGCRHPAASADAGRTYRPGAGKCRLFGTGDKRPARSQNRLKTFNWRYSCRVCWKEKSSWSPVRARVSARV